MTGRLINVLIPIIPMRAEGSDYNVDDDDGGGDDDFRAKQLKCKHSKKPASIKKCSFMQSSHHSKFMTA